MIPKPASYDTTREIPEIYSGVPTFMGLPAIREKESIKKYDVVFMGAPWEGICTWGSYTGCELATKSIRKASVRYGGFLPEMGYDVFDHLKGADYGDAATHFGQFFINIRYKSIHIKIGFINIIINIITIIFCRSARS